MAAPSSLESTPLKGAEENDKAKANQHSGPWWCWMLVAGSLSLAIFTAVVIIGLAVNNLSSSSVSPVDDFAPSSPPVGYTPYLHVANRTGEALPPGAPPVQTEAALADVLQVQWPPPMPPRATWPPRGPPRTPPVAPPLLPPPNATSPSGPPLAQTQ